MGDVPGTERVGPPYREWDLVRPRILMVVENNGYPSDPRVRAEASALTAAGYRVTVIAPSEPGEPATQTIEGVRVLRYLLPRSAGGALGYAAEYIHATLASLALVVRVLVRPGFDVIHLHNPPDTLWLAALPAKIAGKALVFDHHDLAPEMYDAIFAGRSKRPLRWLLALMERMTFRLADHVISTNESYRAIAVERGGLAWSRTTVVRNGPDLNRVRRVTEDHGIRARAKTIIGYVGQMGQQDGLDHLLEAARHLVVTLGQRDVLFMLIGYGDALENLRFQARALEIEPYVWFTGRVADDETFRRYLSTADICVTPDPANSYTERSTMIKMMEYMALAKPVVAFDLRENRASAGEAAVYVGRNDSLAFAKAINDLIGDPDRRAQLGKIGRRRLEAGLTWDHSVPDLLRAYDTVLRSPRKRFRIRRRRRR